MDAQIETYKKKGYIILKDIISPVEIHSILTEAKNIFFRQFCFKKYTNCNSLNEISEKEFNQCMFRLFEEDLECLSNCGKQVQHLISLHRLSLSEKLIHQLKLIGLKTPVISTRPVLYFNHPKLARKKVFYKVDAHQDWRSMQGSLNAVVIWIPLIDISKDLGALEILPQSHLGGLRTNHVDNGFGMVDLSEAERRNLISVELNAGDALIFSSFLIHQSGENSTESPRWSCHFRYNDLDDPTFIARKFAHPYIYKPSEELITNGFPNLSEIKNIFS